MIVVSEAEERRFPEVVLTNRTTIIVVMEVAGMIITLAVYMTAVYF